MIRGLLFDLNGTLIDIGTDEGRDDLYRVLSHFLSYYGVDLGADELRELYFELNRKQRRESEEPYPEFDVVALFREMLERHPPDSSAPAGPGVLRKLPDTLARLFRAASLYRLQLYPEVLAVLDSLRGRYAMAAVSDGQSLWERAELRATGLNGYFDPVIISGELGFRKPDSRIFELALSLMGLRPDEALFIGNDMYRDVLGAHKCGMKTIFFQSNQGERRSRGVEPDYIIYRFDELPAAIEFLSR